MHETRSLILVVLIMLGFQYRAGFEAGLGRLPDVFAGLKLGSMGMMMLSLGLLAMPAMYRRLALRGRSPDEIRFLHAKSVKAALVPFAVSLGLDVTVSAAAIQGTAFGWTLGGGATALALLLWYGLRIGHRAPEEHPALGRFAGISLTPRTVPPNPADTKVDQVLGEIRSILPGAQALLGLQFSVALMQGFETLPETPRTVYLASLGLVALATILLMAPAALRRGGERFHRLASGILVAAMAALSLALSGDVYVAASRVARFTDLAAAAAALTALFFYVLWFAIPLLRRRSSVTPEPRLARG